MNDDNQQYGPWAYEATNCIEWDNNEITIPTADVKEGLHMLPWGYTAAAGATEKTRHRMIGNGWHIGTAMFLLFTLLAEPTEAARRDNLQETVWHRRGSDQTSHSTPSSRTQPKVTASESTYDTSSGHGIPTRHWREYCEINETAIVERRSGSQAPASESKTALRSMGVKDSPTLGDDGDLRVRESYALPPLPQTLAFTAALPRAASEL